MATTPPTATAGKVMFIIAWVFAFGLLIIFFSTFGTHKGEAHYSASRQTLTLTPDSQGHYWIEGQLNEVDVRFMVDTGATYVAIPKNLAANMGLRGRYPITINTAAGAVSGELARVQKIRFGNFLFTNIKVVIMPEVQSNTVLLGMNVLSQFSITQKDNQLIIKREYRAEP